MAEYRTRMGARIAHERKRKGLERHDLAHLSGVSPRQIQRLETGKTESPRRRTIEALAEALTISVDELRPPDPIEEEEALRAQLDRMEETLTELSAATFEEILPILGLLHEAHEDRARQSRPSARTRRAS